MALSLRPLGHIRGNFTHIAMMNHIFDAGMAIAISTWIFHSRLAREHRRKATSYAMINTHRVRLLSGIISESIFWIADVFIMSEISTDMAQ